MPDTKNRFRFSLKTMLMLVLAYALGLATPDIASRLRRIATPRSSDPIRTLIDVGDQLNVELQRYADDGLRTYDEEFAVVQANGTVQLRIGTFHVAGQDFDSVDEALSKAYDSHVQVWRKRPPNGDWTRSF